MKKNALTTMVGILLVLYAITNFGASMGQFAKGKTVSGTTSMAASIGNFAGDRVGAEKVQKSGATQTLIIYAIAVFILLTAALDIVAAVGLFGGQKWAFIIVTIAAICGLLVEMQDTFEDGFGIGKLIFFAINAAALFTAFYSKDPQLATE